MLVKFCTEHQVFFIVFKCCHLLFLKRIFPFGKKNSNVNKGINFQSFPVQCYMCNVRDVEVVGYVLLTSQPVIDQFLSATSVYLFVFFF